MPSLDEALELLAEHDRPVPFDTLIGRIERRLRRRATPHIVGDAIAPKGLSGWRRSLIVFAGAAIAIGVIAIPALLMNAQAPSPPTSPSATPPIATMAPITTTTTTAPSTSPATSSTVTTGPVGPMPFGPTAITLTRDVVDNSATSPGTFTATGPLVDSSIMCGGGNTFEDRFRDLGGGRETWEARFVCSDGSGSFTLIVESRGEWSDAPGGIWEFTTTWSWSTDDGSGAYALIEGSGGGSGSCSVSEDRCIESLDGTIARISPSGD